MPEAGTQENKVNMTNNSYYDKTIDVLQQKLQKMHAGFVLTEKDAQMWFANRGFNCAISGKLNKGFIKELKRRKLLP